jgi:hypothetical protein
MTYKQSSVDFYAEKSLDLFNLFQQGSITINDFRARMSIIEIEAKEMHEEEIKNAYGNEQSKLQDDGSWKTQTAEQYYELTYKGNK